MLCIKNICLGQKQTFPTLDAQNWILICCERISVFRKNEYKQDLRTDYSGRIITSPNQIAYLIEYSTKKILGFVQLSFLI
jgi:hypothetical protein